MGSRRNVHNWHFEAVKNTSGGLESSNVVSVAYRFARAGADVDAGVDCDILENE